MVGWVMRVGRAAVAHGMRAHVRARPLAAFGRHGAPPPASRMMLAGVPVTPTPSRIVESATLVVAIQEAHDRSMPKIRTPSDVPRWTTPKSDRPTGP